ncbi:hypothetical protein L1049_015080 [Liquidambar formosana]|uniref:Uncharacterized protein n=1 Tax=Liquidambar formosana TaxID=63359 RepID=A0AAP0RY88_LIQFO
MAKKQIAMKQPAKRKPGKTKDMGSSSRSTPAMQFRSNISAMIKLMKNIKLTDMHITELKKTPFWLLFEAFISNRVDSLRCKKIDDDAVKIIQTYNPKSRAFQLGNKIVKLRKKDLESMNTYEWSGAIHSCLMASIEKSYASPEKVTGCVIALLFWLCEHTTIVEPDREDEFPRFLKWNLSTLKRKMQNKSLRSLQRDEVLGAELQKMEAEENLGAELQKTQAEENLLITYGGTQATEYGEEQQDNEEEEEEAEAEEEIEEGEERSEQEQEQEGPKGQEEEEENEEQQYMGEAIEEKEEQQQRFAAQQDEDSFEDSDFAGSLNRLCEVIIAQTTKEDAKTVKQECTDTRNGATEESQMRILQLEEEVNALKMENSNKNTAIKDLLGQKTNLEEQIEELSIQKIKQRDLEKQYAAVAALQDQIIKLKEENLTQAAEFEQNIKAKDAEIESLRATVQELSVHNIPQREIKKEFNSAGHKRMRMFSEEDHGSMASSAGMDDGFGKKKQKTSSKVIDDSDPYATPNLLGRFDFVKFGSVAKDIEALFAQAKEIEALFSQKKEIEALPAHKMQMRNPDFAMHPTLPNRLVDVENQNKEVSRLPSQQANYVAHKGHITAKSQMSFEWNEYCGHQDFDVKTVNVDESGDLFLDCSLLHEDMKVL